MSSFGDNARGPPAYIISFDIQNVGRTIARSKKRITWKFVFEGDPDEHMVALIHSVTSGKKVVVLDGQNQYTDEEVSMGEWTYTFQFQNHSLSVYIGNNPTSEDYYDLRIDNMTSRMLPHTTMLDHRERVKKQGSPAKQTLDDFTAPKERSVGGGGGKKSGGRKPKGSSKSNIRRPSTNTKPNQQASSDTFDWQVAGAGGANFDPFAEGGDSDSESSENQEFDPFHSGNATATTSNGQHSHKGNAPQNFDPFEQQSSAPQKPSQPRADFDPFEQQSNAPQKPAQPNFDPFGDASGTAKGSAGQQSDFDPFDQPAKSKPSASPESDFDPFSQPSQDQRESNAMRDIYHKAATNTETSPEDDLSQLRFDTEGPKIGDSTGGTQPPNTWQTEQETEEDMISRLENNPMDDSWNISGPSTGKTGKVPLNAMKGSHQQKKQVMEPPSTETPASTGMGWGGMYQPPRGQYPPGQMPPQRYPYQGYPPQGYPPQGYPPQGGMPPQGYGAPNMMGGPGGMQQSGPPQYGQPAYNPSMGMGGGAPAPPPQQKSNNNSQKNLDFDPFADF